VRCSSLPGYAPPSLVPSVLSGRYSPSLLRSTQEHSVSPFRLPSSSPVGFGCCLARSALFRAAAHVIYAKARAIDARGTLLEHPGAIEELLLLAEALCIERAVCVELLCFGQRGVSCGRASAGYSIPSRPIRYPRERGGGELATPRLGKGSSRESSVPSGSPSSLIDASKYLSVESPSDQFKVLDVAV